MKFNHKNIRQDNRTNKIIDNNAVIAPKKKSSQSDLSCKAELSSCQKIISLICCVFVLFLIIGTSGTSIFAMPWSRDMVDQKNIKPQERIRSYPVNTVSQNAPERVLRIKKIASKLTNSRPSTKESILQGKKLYEMVCIVCHNHDGTDNTPVSKKLKGVRIEPLDIDSLTDGQIYAQVRFGKYPMPSYSANFAPDEIWDVIHYLRTLKVPMDLEEEDEEDDYVDEEI